MQSAMRIKDPFALELEYTRGMLAFLLFQPDPRDIALIGLGGGSLAKYIHRHLPDSRLTALEINAEVVAAARSYFLLPQDDARPGALRAAWAAAWATRFWSAGEFMAAASEARVEQSGLDHLAKDARSRAARQAGAAACAISSNRASSH